MRREPNPPSTFDATGVLLAVCAVCGVGAALIANFFGWGVFLVWINGGRL